MPHIFLSYAKNDTRDLVVQIAGALASSPEITVWWDNSLKVGDAWEATIQEQIESCDYFVVLISPDVNRSPKPGVRRSYVLKEILFAQDRQKPVIVVLAQKTNIPLSLIDLQYVDLTKNETLGIKNLVEQICEIAGLPKPTSIEYGASIAPTPAPNTSVETPSSKPLHKVVVMDGIKLTHWIDVRGTQLKVLDNVSFRLRAGENVVVTGQDALEKVSLLRIMAGSEKPKEGQVIFEGRDLVQFSEKDLRKHIRFYEIGFSPQNLKYHLDRGLFSRPTVGDLIVPLLKLHLGMNSTQARNRALELLSLVGLNRAYIGQSLDALPPFMERLVSLARGICCNPKVLLLEDPLENLTDVESKILQEVLIEKLAWFRDGILTGFVITASNPEPYLEIIDTRWHLEHGKLIIHD
ncbi:MAG: hypothetical protein BroJett018_53330 [Chloroflexota bacterium]|nr:MAG: hypothetical protein BroJett018_53330 [Chloroflexota bacterium]